MIITPVVSVQQIRYAAAVLGMTQAADKWNLIQHGLVYALV